MFIEIGNKVFFFSVKSFSSFCYWLNCFFNDFLDTLNLNCLFVFVKKMFIIPPKLYKPESMDSIPLSLSVLPDLLIRLVLNGKSFPPFFFFLLFLVYYIKDF